MHLQAEVGVGLEGKEQTGPSREEPGGEQKPLTDAQNNWVLPAERLYVRPRSCVTHLYTSRAVPHTLESAERNTGPLARAPGQSRGDTSLTRLRGTAQWMGAGLWDPTGLIPSPAISCVALGSPAWAFHSHLV